MMYPKHLITSIRQEIDKWLSNIINHKKVTMDMIDDLTKVIYNDFVNRLSIVYRRNIEILVVNYDSKSCIQTTYKC